MEYKTLKLIVIWRGDLCTIYIEKNINYDINKE